MLRISQTRILHLTLKSKSSSNNLPKILTETTKNANPFHPKTKQNSMFAKTEAFMATQKDGNGFYKYLAFIFFGCPTIYTLYSAVLMEQSFQKAENNNEEIFSPNKMFKLHYETFENRKHELPEWAALGITHSLYLETKKKLSYKTKVQDKIDVIDQEITKKIDQILDQWQQQDPSKLKEVKYILENEPENFSKFINSRHVKLNPDKVLDASKISLEKQLQLLEEEKNALLGNDGDFRWMYQTHKYRNTFLNFMENTFGSGIRTFINWINSPYLSFTNPLEIYQHFIINASERQQYRFLEKIWCQGSFSRYTPFFIEQPRYIGKGMVDIDEKMSNRNVNGYVYSRKLRKYPMWALEYDQILETGMMGGTPFVVKAHRYLVAPIFSLLTGRKNGLRTEVQTRKLMHTQSFSDYIFGKYQTLSQVHHYFYIPLLAFAWWPLMAYFMRAKLQQRTDRKLIQAESKFANQVQHQPNKIIEPQLIPAAGTTTSSTIIPTTNQTIKDLENQIQLNEHILKYGEPVHIRERQTPFHKRLDIYREMHRNDDIGRSENWMGTGAPLQRGFISNFLTKAFKQAGTNEEGSLFSSTMPGPR